MNGASLSFPLPTRLDLPAAAPLAKALLAHVGKPVALDASACETLGTPGLQVLLSAARTWREAQIPLSLEAPNDDFLAQLAQFGLSPDDLCSKEADA